MKRFLFLATIIAAGFTSRAQPLNFDSIKQVLHATSDLGERFRYQNLLGGTYLYSQPDSSLIYIQQEIQTARKMGNDSALAIGLVQNGILSSVTGNFPQSIYYGLEGLKTAERSGKPHAIATTNYYLSSFYGDAGDYENSLSYALKAKKIFEAGIDTSVSNARAHRISPFYMGSWFRYASIVMRIGSSYVQLHRPDSALKYTQLSNNYFIAVYDRIVWPSIPKQYGDIYEQTGQFDSALLHYREGLGLAIAQGIQKDIMETGNGLSTVFYEMQQKDSAIYYCMKVLDASRLAQYPLGKLTALEMLARIYKERNNTDSSAKYLEAQLTTRESLFNQQKQMQSQSLTFNEQLRQQSILDEQKAYKQRIRNYGLIGGLAVLVLIIFLLSRNIRHKQRSNAALRKAYSELKTTQAQLVQSEKMASLGELTAGIAHEIQNPLNFVNNFSEVSNELLDEIDTEMKAGNTGEASSMLGDVKQNLEKVIHHGKRADNIVKAMLQHSRSSTGVRELTDVNALADEYLRLAYHGIRAKDKSFNCTLKVSLDPQIEKINIIPQDIGRVLLNLYNNAFYAIAQKKLTQPSFESVVTVTSSKTGKGIELRVMDNGNGIPSEILDKVFQPFFTTKPTGDGTGLGLSLSYDIVKAHGGEIKINTVEGQSTEFVILIPLT